MKGMYTLSLCLLMVVTAAVAWSTTPQLINYQGKILDTSGNPVPDGNYDISFSIYDAPSGGLLKWSETQTGVFVRDGFFNAVMGSSEPLSDTVFNGINRYLEIAISGQAISPRIQFTSVGFAHRIGSIDGATGGTVSGSVVLSPSEFEAEGNAVTVLDANNNAVFEVSVDAFGLSTVSFYEPADAKDPMATLKKSLDIAVQPTGAASLSFFDPVDSKNGDLAVPAKSMEISVNDLGVGSIAFYEPADSKFGLEARKVEMNKSGLVMFGATDQDTSLYVAPNGDIVGLGQITMGANSSDGVQTAVLGFDNEASGDSSSIGGGSYNVTTGTSSVIGGGFSNTANSTGATIGGGSTNTVGGEYATIGGGLNNSAMGEYATIPGGLANVADGMHAFAAGHRAIAQHNGAFVWADQTDQDFVSTADDQFIIRAGGGVGIGTNNPTGILDVVGDPGNNSVNLPNDAVSSPEILDEPGIASSTSSNDIVLPQSVGTPQNVLTITITVPSSGYIMLNGGATLKTTGTSKENQAYFQISDTPSFGPVAPYYTIVGLGDHDSPSKIQYFSVSVNRIFMVEAGTYEFRLEAWANSDNGDGAVTVVVNPFLTAAFFPTAYGAVSSSTTTTSR